METALHIYGNLPEGNFLLSSLAEGDVEIPVSCHLVIINFHGPRLSMFNQQKVGGLVTL